LFFFYANVSLIDLNSPLAITNISNIGTKNKKKKKCNDRKNDRIIHTRCVFVNRDEINLLVIHSRSARLLFFFLVHVRSTERNVRVSRGICVCVTTRDKHNLTQCAYVGLRAKLERLTRLQARIDHSNQSETNEKCELVWQCPLKGHRR